MKIVFNHVSAEIHWQLPSGTIEIDVPIPADGLRCLREEGCFRDKDLIVVEEKLAEKIREYLQNGQIHFNEVNWWGIEYQAEEDTRQAKIDRISCVLANCEVEIGEVYPTEIRTKEISNEKLMECVGKLVDSGAVPSCDLSRYTPLSGNMCKYKLGINL